MLYSGKNVLVIGLGVSGRAAAAFLLKRGANVYGVDRDRELLLHHEELGRLRQKGLHVDHDSERLDMALFDLVVVSPGVPQTHPLYQAAVASQSEVIGEIELACRHIRQRCFGITGSNGKTTTTLLVAHVLQENGFKARALGNIGVPLTMALDEAQSEEILVVELSSWQLETMKACVFDAGAILNITPNHLDRHETMEAYAKAKMRLAACLKPNAPLFMGCTCANEFGAAHNPQTFGFDPSCAIWSDGVQVFVQNTPAFALPEEYRGKRTHDVENLLAAFALCQLIGITGEEFLSAFSTFRKPPHRIEFVKKIKGVAYYNDSKGTNLDAVKKAVASLEGPIYLIAGGVHKGCRYTEWRHAFEGRVMKIFAIGQAAGQIECDLGEFFPVEFCANLQIALENAAARAQPGENILLSPGCASYDMFKDYNHRGDEFKRLVQELGKNA